MRYGSMPRDGGNLLLTKTEYEELLESDPGCKRFLRQFIGARELLNKDIRHTIWLQGINPEAIRGHRAIIERLEAVRTFRRASKAASTRRMADTPGLYGQIAQPDSRYLAFPRHSSERRQYVPIGYFDPDVIAGDSLLVVPDANDYIFGVAMSTMHNAWIRAVGGRIKSDFRYSKDIVYNNFPWPEPSVGQKTRIAETAQNILEIQAQYPDASLADLYDPLTMPKDLRKAHQANDRVVDAAYGQRKFATESERVGFLFGLYEQLTTGSPH